jgi:hypothetical protein
MKKIILAGVLTTLMFTATSVMAGAPDGTSGPWADEVVSFDQGTRKNGTPVLTERSDPTQALGPAENNDTLNFVSLGFGGELVLKFDNCIINEEGDDIDIIETSYGSPGCSSYPETIRVYASKNGTDWVDLGTSCLDGACDLQTLDFAQYIKIVDESDTSKFNATADGFDVDGVQALHSAEQCPQEPEPSPPSNQIIVKNVAIVRNMQFAGANTGGNGIGNSMALGGDSEANNNDNNTIRTGNAWAEAYANTTANSNIREGCCAGFQLVKRSYARVSNTQMAGADTGNNGIGNSMAVGRRADSTARGNDRNMIVTGNATAVSSAYTLVNSNIKSIIER